MRLDPNTRQVRIYDYEGNWLEDTTLEEASKIKGCTKAGIYNVMSGKDISCNRLQFRDIVPGFGIFQLPSILESKRSDTKIVGKYYKNRLICTYHSVLLAAKALDINAQGITDSCNTGRELKGFTFKFII